MKHQINAAIQVVPKTKTLHYYDLVDEAIAVIARSGIKYEVGPMETVLEGTYEEIESVIKAAQQACLDAGADELVVNVKFHIRKAGDITFEEKVAKHR